MHLSRPATKMMHKWKGKEREGGAERGEERTGWKMTGASDLSFVAKEVHVERTGCPLFSL